MDVVELCDLKAKEYREKYGDKKPPRKIKLKNDSKNIIKRDVGRESVDKKRVPEADNINVYQKEILKDPMLFNRLVLDGLDEVVVGEDAARKVIFLCAMGSMVLNATRTSYNLMVNSESGAGKDYLVSTVLELLPKEQVLKRTRITPTALTYWHNSYFEPKWTWDGKVLYLEDCSNPILNCDVFKVFTSGGSYATIVKEQRAFDIKINGKPVVIITSASADPAPELIRRFLVVNLTESKEQTEEIMYKWLEHAERGYIPEIDNDYAKALKHIIPRKVKVPFAKKLMEVLPKKNIIMRTSISRFIDFIKASAVLHQYAREIDTDGYVIAEGQDYKYAREIFLSVSCNDQMVPLTQNQKEVVSIMKELGMNVINEGLGEKEVGWTHSELCTHLPYGRTTVYDIVNSLVKKGFVIKKSYKFDYQQKHAAVYHYKEAKDFNLLTWDEISKI